MSDNGLPSWIAHNQRDRRRMVTWVIREVDEIMDNKFMEWQAKPRSLNSRKEYFAWLADSGPAIKEAEHGNIEPLRQQHPHLAKFLHLPKRGRGQRFPKRRMDLDRVQAAVDYVKRIRALWKKHYGKKNRRSEYGPSAEQIAAERWEVSVENIIQRMKKSPVK